MRGRRGARRHAARLQRLRPGAPSRPAPATRRRERSIAAMVAFNRRVREDAIPASGATSRSASAGPRSTRRSRIIAEIGGEAGVATPALRAAGRADPRHREEASGRSHWSHPRRDARHACTLRPSRPRRSRDRRRAGHRPRHRQRAFPTRARACISPTSIGTELDGHGEPPCSAAGAVVDLGDRDAVQALVTEIAARSGRLDILVNTPAACAARSGRPIEEVPAADWQAIFDVNVRRVLIAQAAAPAHEARALGRIVNDLVGAGLAPEPHRHPGLPAPSTRLVGLTRQLAHELGPWHHREQRRAGLRPLQPDDRTAMGERRGRRARGGYPGASRPKRSARPRTSPCAVLFFASDQAGWITGQVLSVDGGRYADVEAHLAAGFDGPSARITQRLCAISSVSTQPEHSAGRRRHLRRRISSLIGWPVALAFPGARRSRPRDMRRSSPSGWPRRGRSPSSFMAITTCSRRSRWTNG